MAWHHSARFLLRHPLTRHAPLTTLGRWLRWQLGDRLVPGRVAVPWVGGTRLLAGVGETGVTGNLYAGLHDYGEMGLVLHLLRPGDLFVDVGANSGAYTVLACGAAGAHALSFEPGAAAFARLCDNLRLNGLEGRARARRVALGRAHGRVRMSASLDTLDRVLLPSERGVGGEVEVELSTLDLELGDASPLLVKIDTEGYEREVVAGGEAVLARPGPRALIVETNGGGRRFGSPDEAVAAGLRRLGYEPCGYDPRTRELTPLPGGLGGCNTIFVRDRERLARRLREAAPFRVLGVAL